MKKRNVKSQSIIELALVVALLVLLNLILANHFFRIDLTSEKRYSLSEASKNLSAKIDDVLHVKVYLEGEFPAGFKRLRQSAKEMLDEFAAYTGGRLQYEFIDPFENATADKTTDILRELGEKGLQPTNVQIRKDDESSQKLIVPGALFYYKGKELPVNFLKAQFGQGPEEVINESIELLEYEIANVLRKCVEKQTKSVAFIDDHGELDRWEVADASQSLKEFYSVTRISLSLQTPESMSKHDALIVARPIQPFSEYEKFLLDQFVMHGGRILWLLETQIADMDSMGKGSSFMTGSYDLNLDDMLFRWGVRVNPNIVLDLQCNAIPIVSTLRNGTPQQKLLPWMFFPLLSPPQVNPHIIVKGIEPVWMQFAASIDTTAKSGIKKTVLLRSSPYSREAAAPVRVDLDVARRPPDPKMFNTGGHAMAVLVEGSFSSVFENRPGARKDVLNYKERTDYNRMIVVGDGDVIRNQRKKSTGEIFPLGYDRYTNQQFGNKRFILNCMDYLLDDNGIIEIRAKEIKLRLLDKGKLRSDKSFWQFVNLGVPLMALVLFALVNNMVRKRKYAR